jgi:DNA repair protein SbcD/Mre11
LKILHFADLHLGVESYGHLDPATGLSSRLLDFLATLDRVVDYALENRIDLVLFCGDAYRSRDPSQTQQRELARRLNRLTSGGIPIFLLTGNHDLPNALGRATTTEIFDTLAVKNVYVSGRPQVYRISTASGPVQIASLPWPRRGGLLSKEEGKGLTLEEMNQRLCQAMTRVIADMAAGLDPALPAVLAAHVSVIDARIQAGSERTMVIGQEPALLLSNVADPAFDYVALGHIHRHQVIGDNPPAVYSGSLERLDFGDEKDDKGFYVLEIDPGRERGSRLKSLNFQPVPARRFLTIEVPIEPEDADPMASVLRNITDNSEAVKGAIVRLGITLSAGTEGRLRDGEIRAALQDAYYVSVTRQVTREVRPRLGWTAEELSPRDALQRWLETQKLSPERVRHLLERGEKLIAEHYSGPP